jgi:hypothetical protein
MTRQTKITKTLGPIKALGPSDPALKDAVVIKSFSLVAEFAKKIEPAGHGYANLQDRVVNFQKYIDIEEEEKKKANAAKEEVKEVEEEDEEVDEERDAQYEGKKKVKKTREQIDREALEKDNLYDILEIGELGMDATEKKISQAYKKMALKYHPDKLGEKLTTRDKEIWLQI